MSIKSLNSNWGKELVDLGYTKKGINNFDKKYKKHSICINYDKTENVLMFRILKASVLEGTQVIKNIDIKDVDSLTKFSFVSLANQFEIKYKLFIDKEVELA